MKLTLSRICGATIAALTFAVAVLASAASPASAAVRFVTIQNRWSALGGVQCIGANPDHPFASLSHSPCGYDLQTFYASIDPATPGRIETAWEWCVDANLIGTVFLAPCDASRASQRWQFSPVPSGETDTYTIRNAAIATGGLEMCLAVNEWNSNMRTAPCSSSSLAREAITFEVLDLAP